MRTLAFLTLALASIITSSALKGTALATLITLLGGVGGLAGAAYCSYRGVKDATWIPRP